MKRIGILVIGMALVASQGVASAAPTFANCESASNYGKNSANLYVSASMNTADCDSAGLERAELALGRSLRKLKIHPGNTDEMQVCFYEGVFEGYVDALWTGYNECGRALTLGSVARAANTVFAGMRTALHDVSDSAINVVFGWVFDVSGEDTAGCASYLRAEYPGASAPDGLDHLIDVVCFNR
jgi:hypothetical protein